MREKICLGSVFEGESYVGKSSSIEAMKELQEIKEKGIIVVPEYSVIGSLPKFAREIGQDIKKVIERIIDLEKRRTDALTNDLARHKGEVIVFDRGPVSCIAFEYAAEKSGYTGAALWLAEAFQKEIEDKNIIVPTGMIYLHAPKETIEQRERKHISGGHSRILEFLRDDKVITSLNEAFAAFGNFLPKQLFLTLNTGNKNPKEVGAEVLQFIKDQPDDVLEHVPDFVSYANSLIKSKNND